MSVVFCAPKTHASSRLPVLREWARRVCALAVAEHLARELPEPVLMVDLAPIRDPNLVLQTVLAQLGLHEIGDRALERLVQVMQKRRLLILLDNFEQVMPAAQDLPRLLAEAPELRLLVTSRSPLGLRSEHVYPVPPLELPDLHHLPPPDELAEVPSVTLFLARAQAVSPTFELTRGERAGRCRTVRAPGRTAAGDQACGSQDARAIPADGPGPPGASAFPSALGRAGHAREAANA